MSEPTKEEVFRWLDTKKYQTDEVEQGYRVYFALDMPQIMDEYYVWRKYCYEKDNKE